MRALVIGGAGFIGSTLVDRLLAEGHAVDVVDDLSTGSLANLADARADRSHDFTFHRLDVHEPVLVDLVLRRRPDVVYHLALPSADRSADASTSGALADTMVLGAQQVLAAARAAEVGKVVVAVDARHRYGIVSADDLPLAESFPARDESRWGDALRVVIATLETARADDGLEFTALALATVYGPRQPSTAPLRTVIEHARRAGAEVEPDVFALQLGPAWAQSTDDLLFVDDAVDALVRAAARGSGLVINVGTGIATSGAVVAAHVVAAASAAPRAEPADVGPAGPGPVGDVVTHFALDPARAGMQLGWKPWTSVAEGIAATVAATRDHPS